MRGSFVQVIQKFGYDKYQMNIFLNHGLQPMPLIDYWAAVG